MEMLVKMADKSKNGLKKPQDYDYDKTLHHKLPYNMFTQISSKINVILEYDPVVAWVFSKQGTFSGKTHPTWSVSVPTRNKRCIICCVFGSVPWEEFG